MFLFDTLAAKSSHSHRQLRGDYRLAAALPREGAFTASSTRWSIADHSRLQFSVTKKLALPGATTNTGEEGERPQSCWPEQEIGVGGA